MKCQRLVSEWHLAMFSIKDANGKIIDLDASFLCPKPKLLTASWKFLLVAWTIAIMVLSIEGSTDKRFWLAFLTTWSFLFALCYLLLSFVLAAVFFCSSSNTGNAADAIDVDVDATMSRTDGKPTATPATRDEEEAVANPTNDDANDDANDDNNSSHRHGNNSSNNAHEDDEDEVTTGIINHNECNNNNNNNKMTCWTKLIWVLYVISIHSQVFVTLLYWLLVYDGSSVVYPEVYRHGILMILVMMDGFVVNRIPIRLKQIVFVYAYALAYLGWTLIHFGADLGNPETTDNDPDTNDDALYGVISWRDNAGGAVILCLILMLVVIPLMFIFIWGLSLWVPHRYVVYL